MENYLFQLKFTAKTLVRQSKRCEKEEKKQKLLLKKAVEKGNVEGARIYGQNSIRQKKQAMNYLALASRLDGVCAKIQTAVQMGKLSQSMGGVVKAMGESSKNMDLAKMTLVMDQFEKQFEDIDVLSTGMEQSMDSSTSTMIPTDEVDTLIQKVADEHGINVGAQLGFVPDEKMNVDIKNNTKTKTTVSHKV
ncbi:charged multivesicular body protein 1b [Anaeramoeba ignava]|uniref:Charged multivesicular body protein 1b n=1 Tax=Anaeramoeba ignava TaxID=1746090 RepID=A0A9Q0R8G6_ANAIG|nr:charged multivesicular body protein 1b [Anaeramoeba ignava]